MTGMRGMMVGKTSMSCRRMESSIPLQAKDETGSSRTLLLGEKEFLQHLSKEEVSYAIICKPTDNVGTDLLSLLVELRSMMRKFEDIIVDDFPSELPPVRKISHHMDFIPRMSFSQ